MVEAGILESRRGKVRLLQPDELPADWDPATDPRLTAWEIGPPPDPRARRAAAKALPPSSSRKLGAEAEIARELAYRLYVLCERKKRATEALAYNGLVQSWPEIQSPGPARRHSPAVRAQADCSGGGLADGDHQPRARRQGPRLLKDGLAPFVEREFRTHYEADSARRGRRATSPTTASVAGKPIAEWDAAALLKLMWEAWNDVFRKTLGRPSAASSASCATCRNKLGAPGEPSPATTPTARSTPSAAS